MKNRKLHTEVRRGRRGSERIEYTVDGDTVDVFVTVENHGAGQTHLRFSLQAAREILGSRRFTSDEDFKYQLDANRVLQVVERDHERDEKNLHPAPRHLGAFIRALLEEVAVEAAAEESSPVRHLDQMSEEELIIREISAAVYRFAKDAEEELRCQDIEIKDGWSYGQFMARFGGLSDDYNRLRFDERYDAANSLDRHRQGTLEYLAAAMKEADARELSELSIKYARRGMSSFWFGQEAS